MVPGYVQEEIERSLQQKGYIISAIETAGNPLTLLGGKDIALLPVFSQAEGGSDEQVNASACNNGFEVTLLTPTVWYAE